MKSVITKYTIRSQVTGIIGIEYVSEELFYIYKSADRIFTAVCFAIRGW